MQHGIFLLWLLSLFASAGCWLYLEVTFFCFGRQKTRRRLTGCELARQLLDLSGLRQATVTSLPVRGRAHLSAVGEAVRMSEGVYYGTRLSDLSLALHEAGHFLATHSPVPPFLRQGAGRSLRIPLVASWLFVGAGAFFPPVRWLASLGYLIFLTVFFLAFASLPEEGEVTERAVAVLTKLEGFELDEKVRLKRLLKALFVLPLAEVFAGLLEMSKRATPSKKDDSQHVHHFTGV